MSTLMITLSDAERALIEHEARLKGIESPQEYLQQLVERELYRLDNQRIDQLLIEGLRSEAREMTAEEWADIRREVFDGADTP